jgi:hypothetical protein
MRDFKNREKQFPGIFKQNSIAFHPAGSIDAYENKPASLHHTELFSQRLHQPSC